jgi:hypothetical protein
MDAKLSHTALWQVDERDATLDFVGWLLHTQQTHASEPQQQAIQHAYDTPERRRP